MPARLTIRSPSSRTCLLTRSRSRTSQPRRRRPSLRDSNVDPKPWPGRAPNRIPTVEAVAEPQPGVPFDGEDEEEDGEGRYEPMERRRNFAPLIAAVVVLAVLAGGGYAVWLNKDDFQAMLGIGGSQTLTSAPVARRSDSAGGGEEDRQR